MVKPHCILYFVILLCLKKISEYQIPSTMIHEQFATLYKEDLEYMSKCILDYPDIETGGDFFGFWNNLGYPVILYVTGPGRNAYRNSSFFKQDLDFLIEIGNYLFSRFGLQHIGSWHSHHQLSLAVPSSHDCETMSNAIQKNRLEKFFMILGNITHRGGTTVNGFLFDKDDHAHYTETVWNILTEENPIKRSVERHLKKELQYQPKTKHSKLQDLKLMKGNSQSVFTLDFEPETWLGSENGRQELKLIYDWFSQKFTHSKMLVTESKSVKLISEEIHIIFKEDFPNSHPEIVTGEEPIPMETGRFSYRTADDIIQFIITKIPSMTTDFQETTNH